MGRKRKLEPELVDKMAKLFELGCAVLAVHDAVCISDTLYYRWVHDGERAIEKRDREGADNLTEEEIGYIYFLETINQAKARFQEKCLNTIQAATPKTWQAAAWLLERRNPKDFSIYAQSKVKHEGEVKITFEDIKPGKKSTDKEEKKKT